MLSDIDSTSGEDFSKTVRTLARICHSCGICPYAASMPDSTLDRVMRWHRSWCPAWRAHSRVYGEKPLAVNHQTPQQREVTHV